MLFPNYKVHHLRRVRAMALGGLALLVLSGYVLGGCAGVTDVAPSSQVQTPIAHDQSSTPVTLPTEQPTAPRLLPSPEQTAPIIPTPEPTFEPTLPPPPPTFTPYPTFTRLPTPTPAAPILLTDPVAEPKENENGGQWFASTGHTIHGIFLDYWNTHGEMGQFGVPLTEEFVEARGPDHKPVSVQYFERSIF